VNYTNGLAILRRISPERDLEDRLDLEGQIIAIDTGSGRDRRTLLHVDDDVPRDDWLSQRITGTPAGGGGMVGGCTDGWSIVDESNNVRGFYTSLVRAQEAVSRAKVTIVTDVELEEEAAEKAPPKSKAAPEAVSAAA